MTYIKPTKLEAGKFEEAWAKHRAETEIEDGWCDVEEENERIAFTAGWNAALEAAKKKMPPVTPNVPRSNWDDGWNGAAKIASQVIAALKET